MGERVVKKTNEEKHERFLERQERRTKAIAKTVDLKWCLVLLRSENDELTRENRGNHRLSLSGEDTPAQGQ